MSHIVLTEEQARIITDSADGIEIHDPQGRLLGVFRTGGRPGGLIEVQDSQGRHLGVLHLLSPEEAALVEKVKQRRQTPGPRIPGTRVPAMLKTLDAMQQTEEVTREKVAEILRKVKCGEPL